MNMLDKARQAARRLREKAGDAAAEHGDKIDRGIDKAAVAAESRVGDKHQDKVRRAAAKAKDAVDDLADEGPPKRNRPGG